MLTIIGLLLAVYVTVRGADIAFTHIIRAWPNPVLLAVAAATMLFAGMLLFVYGAISCVDILEQVPGVMDEMYK